jgi:hypothetical protein
MRRSRLGTMNPLAETAVRAVDSSAPAGGERVRRGRGPAAAFSPGSAGLGQCPGRRAGWPDPVRGRKPPDYAFVKAGDDRARVTEKAIKNGDLANTPVHAGRPGWRGEYVRPGAKESEDAASRRLAQSTLVLREHGRVPSVLYGHL